MFLLKSGSQDGFCANCADLLVSVLKCGLTRGFVVADTAVARFGLDGARCLGLDSRQMVPVSDAPDAARVFRKVMPALEHLVSAAKIAGFDVGVASGFRSFERQLQLWNAKALGLRPLLDKDEKPLDGASLSARERLFAILRWSALPGASRHHWGTEIDIFDAGALAEGQRLQLTVAETQKKGPFYGFYLWLADYLADSQCLFYRPYAVDLGGVAPEPWHLSHRELSANCQLHFSLAQLIDAIKSADIALKKEIMANIDEIHQRFIANTCD